MYLSIDRKNQKDQYTNNFLIHFQDFFEIVKSSRAFRTISFYMIFNVFVKRSKHQDDQVKIGKINIPESLYLIFKTFLRLRKVFQSSDLHLSLWSLTCFPKDRKNQKDQHSQNFVFHFQDFFEIEKRSRAFKSIFFLWSLVCLPKDGENKEDQAKIGEITPKTLWILYKTFLNL